jgi:protein-disulfide isomerase
LTNELHTRYNECMSAAETPAKTETTQKKRDYFEIRFPKFPKGNLTFTHFLTLLAIIFAYLLGAMTVKLQYLEQNGTGGNAQALTANDQTPEPSPIINVAVDPGNLPMLGNKDAKVTIVEFSDFQCPFCKRFYEDAMAQIKKEYVDTGKVKIAYRHYPLSFHPHAGKAGEASECANDQGKFWEYHDILFENQEGWSGKDAAGAAEDFVSYAGELGLDTGTFSTCLSSDKYAEKVKQDEKAGNDAGVSATPTFYVNGRQVVGALPFAEFKTVIEEQLKK